MNIPFQYGRLTKGHDRTRVDLYYLKTPGSLVSFFTGGRPHVGAVSVGVRAGPLHLLKTLRIPGHREDAVTRQAGEILSKKIPGSVVVGAGIHYNRATRQEIRMIVNNSKSLCQNLLSQLHNHRG